MSLVVRALVAGFTLAALSLSVPAQTTLDPAIVGFKLPDQIAWKDNPSGNRTAVLQGDPSKSGPYAVLLQWLPGKMSRPHFHPDERYCLVLRGTWYTGESKEWVTDKAKLVGLKPGEYMRHPAAGPHYDGALDEDVGVAISGYGPTSATVIDGGELFGAVPK